MPYDTKADYEANYRTQADPLIGGRGVNDPPVFIHYNYAALSPGLQKMWQTLAPILNPNPTEPTLIVGAGFGWGIEAYIAATGAVNVVGTDISAYVHAEKENTEEAELREYITAAGLDPNSGRGAVVLSALLSQRPGPRSNVIVLNEDAQTNTSRQAIRAVLSAWPSICILENIIEETTTAQEITQVNNAMDNFAGTQRIIWIVSPLDNWTPASVAALTGAEAISTNGTDYTVP